MALTDNQTKLNELYQKNFGRNASFNNLGGADYWLNTHKPQTSEDWGEINRMLAGSQEGKQFADTQKVRPGAVNPALSMAENAAKGNVWANHFTPTGVLGAGKDLTNTIFAGKGAGEKGNQGTSDSAAALNNIAKDIKFEVPNSGKEYFNQGINAQLFDNNQRPIDNHEIAQTTGPDNTTISSGALDDKAAAALAAAAAPAAAASAGGGGTGAGEAAARPGIDIGSGSGSGNWYDGYGSGEEWLKANPQDSENSDSGMNDFMKFMMLMSVMGGGRGMGGGGYGGSQFGYGGLNPGGVQAAYDPMAQLQGMGTWFKDNFGSGSGSASTGNLNTPS